jgi:hypothetical protein
MDETARPCDAKDPFPSGQPTPMPSSNVDFRLSESRVCETDDSRSSSRVSTVQSLSLKSLRH